MFSAMKRSFLPAAWCALAVLALAQASGAQAQTVVQTAQVRAELTAERPVIAPGESVWVALTLDIIPGWHTYWRTPGDSGAPTDMRWSLPDGVTAGAIQWPAPERVPYADLMNFAYHDRVTLLAELTVAASVAPGPQVFKLESTWLVCADVCIPQDGSFELPLSIAGGGAQMNTADGGAIAAARAQLPQPAPWPVSLARKGTTLTLSAGPDAGLGKISGAAFFPYDEGILNNPAPQDLRVADDTLRLSMTAGDANPSEVSGVLVLEGGATRVGYTVTANVIAPAATVAEGFVPLIVAMGLALLGGIILNAMPCVLPVLVMKAMSFMSRGTGDAGALRRDGLAYTAGVMVTFGALVGVLLGLRAAGTAVGWGFQLQAPAFVAGLAYVMLALGLNLSGVFHIGGTFGVGQNLAARSGPTGSFFTGMLAVVVATPCTAPFMGTAIGFALTQSSLEAVLIFEALALGLALPYLVLSFAPGVARKLPRPGPWMERTKQVLAFPLYGAAAWLVWVVAQQLDGTGFAAALTGLVLVGFAAWLWGIAQQATPAGRRWSLATAGLALMATTALVATLSGRPAPAAAQADGLSEPYTAARLATLRAEGRAVFVNFTAAWCITCKVNERIALSTPEVEQAFKSRDVAYLKGDWTNRNSEISAALEAVGRDGVPLYLYYPPRAAAPTILPQVLTPGTVLAVIGGD